VKRGGNTCKECCAKISSDTLKKIRANQTPEERSFHSAQARSKVKFENLSRGVKKQWEGFRADPEKYERICHARSVQSKKMWSEHSDEIRNKIVSALVSSNNCGRSKLSDDFKNALIEGSTYDGFVSEEIFHGFVPDEINHELKIIIEVFGDLYHCNPRKYKNPEVFINATKRTVGEQWQRDRIKLACYYKHGYTVIVVWESDIRNCIQDQVERVKNEIAKKREPGSILREVGSGD